MSRDSESKTGTSPQRGRNSTAAQGAAKRAAQGAPKRAAAETPLWGWLERLRARYPTALEFVLFCFVGGTGVVVDYAVLVPLTELGGLDPRISAVGAFTAAVTWNYFLNRKLTFRVGGTVAIPKSYVAFVVVCLVGLAVRIAVMHVLMEWFFLGRGRLYLLASLAGIVAATVVNFMGSKFIVFKKPQ
jgi:putative flippase GtrA